MGQTETKRMIWLHFNTSGEPQPSRAKYHECPNCGETFDAVWPMKQRWRYCPMCGKRVELDWELEEE